jgi:hypothetical protein
VGGGEERRRRRDSTDPIVSQVLITEKRWQVKERDQRRRRNWTRGE